jgi:hypothetical protein
VIELQHDFSPHILLIRRAIIALPCRPLAAIAAFAPRLPNSLQRLFFHGKMRLDVCLM